MGTDSVTKTRTLVQIKEPPKYKVIYMNDDVTTMEFVIESLVVVFNMPRDDAFMVTEKIHSEGSAVVAVLPYELAEQKGIEVTLEARAQGYPLQVKVEAEKV